MKEINLNFHNYQMSEKQRSDMSSKSASDRVESLSEQEEAPHRHSKVQDPQRIPDSSDIVAKRKKSIIYEMGSLLKESKQFRVDCFLKIRKAKFSDKFFTDEGAQQIGMKLKKDRKVYAKFKVGDKEYSTKTARMDKKLVFEEEEPFEIPNIHQLISKDQKQCFLQICLYQQEGMMNTKLLGAIEGIFFEEIITSCIGDKEDVQKLSIFRDGKRIGSLEVVLRTRQKGQMPNEIKEQIKKMQTQIQEIEILQKNEASRMDTIQQDLSLDMIQINIEELQLFDFQELLEFAPIIKAKYKKVQVKTKPPKHIKSKIDGTHKWHKDNRFFIRYLSDQDIIQFDLLNYVKQEEIKLGSCAIKIADMLRLQNDQDKYQENEKWFKFFDGRSLISKFRISCRLVEQEQQQDVTWSEVQYELNRDRSNSVMSIQHSQINLKQLNQDKDDTNNSYVNLIKSPNEKAADTTPKQKIFQTQDQHLLSGKNKTETLTLPEQDVISKKGKSERKSKSQKSKKTKTFSTRSPMSKKSKRSQRNRDSGGPTINPDFAAMLGGNLDEQTLLSYQEMFVNMIKSGQLDLNSGFGNQELPSYQKLMTVIEENHPLDPKTKERFSLRDRVTVKDYESKIADLFYFYNVRQFFRRCCKFIKRKCKPDNRIKFIKPESLQDLPDSDSCSSDSEDDGMGINGLTVCATKLGEGAALYLQTMKTLMIMFFILSVVNIPIFFIYAQHTRYNDYSNVFQDTFKYFTLGNLGQTMDRCGSTKVRFDLSSEEIGIPRDKEIYPDIRLECEENQYISEIKHFGLLYKVDKTFNTYSSGQAICQKINSPYSSISTANLTQFESIPITNLSLFSPDTTSELFAEVQQPEWKPLTEISYILPEIVERGEINQYDFCKNSCLDQNLTYCVSKSFDYNNSVCFKSPPQTFYFNLTQNQGFLEKTNETLGDDYICWNKSINSELNPQMQVFICPNHELCSGQKIIVPDYGKDVKYTNEVGLQRIDQRDSVFTKTGAPTKCQFWIRRNPEMKQQDLLWLSLSNKHSNPEIKLSVEKLDKESLITKSNSKFTPFAQQSIASRDDSFLVEIDWSGTDLEGDDLQFETWIEMYNQIYPFRFYSDEMLSYNKTVFNIDTQCYNERLFVNPFAYQRFTDQFNTLCKNQNNCSIDPFDVDFMFDQLVSDECRFRQTSTNITSSEFVLVVGCQMDEILLFPTSTFVVHKQKAGLIIVSVEILSLLIITFFFSKIKNVNDEFLQNLDNITVKIQDFGVMFTDVHLDKSTQDTNIIRMKLWLYLHEILKDKRTADNKNEIIDITFTIFSEPHMQCLFKMDEYQKSINDLNQLIFKGDPSDGSTDRYKSEVDKLENKLKRLKERYRELISRGSKFKKEELRYKPKSQRIKSIKYVFVLFKSCLTQDVALQNVGEQKGFLSRLKAKLTIQKSKKKNDDEDDQQFCGKQLNIEPLITPNEINWKNFNYSYEEHLIRLLSVYLIGIVFAFGNLCVFIYITQIKALMDKKVPDLACPSYDITKQMAFDDYISHTDNGLMECYCQDKVNVFLPWTFFISFDDVSPGDKRRYCLEVNLLRQGKIWVLAILAVEAVLINELISLIFLGLGKITKRQMKYEGQSFTFRQIFILEFFNMGLIAMINGFDYLGLNEFLLGGQEIGKNQLFQGFTSDWYMYVGQFICFSLFVSSFAVNIKELLIFFYRISRRCCDRGYRLKMKRDPDDEDDDTPNTKLKTQKELEQLYIGREFQGEKAFSRMMSTLFVILSYSSGMPVLYVVGVIFYTITFFVSKLLILKFYRKSTNLSKTIPVISTNAMKLGIILHILFGCVMLTNPQPFTTLQKSDLSNFFTNFLGSDDILTDIQQIEIKENGATRITSSEVVVEIIQRIQYMHQQIYIAFLIIFAFIYVLWRATYDLFEVIFTTVFYVLRKIIVGIGRGIKREVKRIRCKIQNAPYIDTQESELFTLTDQDDVTSAESEGSMESSQDLRETQDKLDDLQKMKRSIDLTTPDQQTPEGEIDKMILDLECALMRKDILKKEKEKKRQQRIENKKALEKIIREKRMQRPDYSPNILLDMHMQQLRDFYERAQKELRDFWYVFHQTDELPPEMLDPESTDQLRVNFLELCYICHITQDQVVLYQKLLKKRLRDIESIIDQHFVMIQPNILDDVRGVFEKKKKNLKKEGIDLTIQQQLQLEKDEQYALKHSSDVQFDNPHYYPYQKKLKKLIIHEENLKKNDINRMENRRGIQEIVRIDKGNNQSYFILDNAEYQLARKFYFSIDPHRDIEEQEFMEQLMEQQNLTVQKSQLEQQEEQEEQQEPRRRKSARVKSSSQKSGGRK